MNREELLQLLGSLNLPKTEYYILSGGALLLYGLRQTTDDLDLCVSNELFLGLQKKYNLQDNNKNQYGFYQLASNIELVPNCKEDFNLEYIDGYPVESLEKILIFKEKRNAEKDQKDIENIKKYLKKDMR